jgi:hypothetical protein
VAVADTGSLRRPSDGELLTGSCAEAELTDRNLLGIRTHSGTTAPGAESIRAAESQRGGFLMAKMNRRGSLKQRRLPVRLFLPLLAFAISTISSASARAELLYVTLDNKTVMSYDISLATAADIQNSAQTFLDLSNLSLPVGLAFDSAGNVYVGDFLGNTISKYSFSGSLLQYG